MKFLEILVMVDHIPRFVALEMFLGVLINHESIALEESILRDMSVGFIKTESHESK